MSTSEFKKQTGNEYTYSKSGLYIAFKRVLDNYLKHRARPKNFLADKSAPQEEWATNYPKNAPEIPRPMICLNSVIDWMRWSRTISLQVWTSTPVLSSLLVVAITG